MIRNGAGIGAAWLERGGHGSSGSDAESPRRGAWRTCLAYGRSCEDGRQKASSQRGASSSVERRSRPESHTVDSAASHRHPACTPLASLPRSASLGGRRNLDAPGSLNLPPICSLSALPLSTEDGGAKWRPPSAQEAAEKAARPPRRFCAPPPRRPNEGRRRNPVRRPLRRPVSLGCSLRQVVHFPKRVQS